MGQGFFLLMFEFRCEEASEGVIGRVASFRFLFVFLWIPSHFCFNAHTSFNPLLTSTLTQGLPIFAMIPAPLLSVFIFALISYLLIGDKLAVSKSSVSSFHSLWIQYAV